MKFCVRIFVCLLCGAAVAAAQHLHWKPPAAAGVSPDTPEIQKPADTLQERQSHHRPLSWKYPGLPPVEEPNYPPDFELRAPEVVNTVTAVCGPNTVRVEAKKDLLGIGKPVQAADVTLGGCPVTGEDREVLVFESVLHGCGSELLMSEDSIVYSFMLVYTPSPLGNSQIVRTRDVQVSIQCHYQRKHDVSSGHLNPIWTPFSDAKSTDENLLFSLRLMTDDWQFPRPITQFLLGDMMRFEVSVKQFHHTPLRVMVDSCVATVVPNPDTVPRYAFLGNNGCLFDSQLTGSSSRFLTRTQDDRLQFEVEAFKFQDNSGEIYITCILRAIMAAEAVDATNKACSYINGWREASGSHQACSCCDTDCGRVSQGGTVAKWNQEISVGPIDIRERPLRK